MTVAVVLDSKTTGQLNPEQVQALVGNAVGFNTERGDTVQVESLPFDTTAAEAAQAEIKAAEQAQRTQGYIDLGKRVGLWMLGLLVVLFLLKRWRRRDDETTVEATATDLPAEGVVIPPQLEPTRVPALTAPEALDRDQVREEVAALVENQPDDVATMLQGWLDEQKA
jgi:flagellar M-ring protein FliF